MAPCIAGLDPLIGSSLGQAENGHQGVRLSEGEVSPPVLDPGHRRLSPPKASLGHLVGDIKLGQAALPPGSAEQLSGESLGLLVLLVHTDHLHAARSASGRSPQ